jgi:CelD/BcsL family acetyltransferase involved in cellulose biosynthesis
MSGLVAEVIDKTTDLEALTPEWWDLWRRCPSAMPFQAPGWLLPWWRHFAPERSSLWRRGWRSARGPGPRQHRDGALGRRILPLGIS